MLRIVMGLATTVWVYGQIPEVAGTPVTAFSFRYLDLRTGEGPEAQQGQKYTVHYTGWLTDGTKFDSSVDRNEPLEFVQGRRNVIAGWEAGFAGMRVGGKRRLLIPWQMAYGEKGSGPIPARADLTFDVELLRVHDAAAQPAAFDLIAPLDRLKSKLVRLAEAMPEDRYSWRPAPGARSFGEAMMHVALANRLMYAIAVNGLAGEALTKQIATNSKDERAPRSKGEIVRGLEESFGETRTYLETARAGTLAADITFFGIDGNRRTVFAFRDTHVAEHLGQAIAYARSNGINPPWSGN